MNEKRALDKIPRELNKENIDQAIADYLDLVKAIPIEVEAKNVLDFLHRIKRSKLNAGPYPHVTLFETANRVMTDLIILYGVKELLEGRLEEIHFDNYLIELGHDNFNDNDILAANEKQVLIGEAFNVATSFFQVKKAKSLQKMRLQDSREKILVLIYNSDAVEPHYTPKPRANEYHLPIELDI